ncbi:hypothetical protein ACFW04_013201 [Cataglyphis niger]
MLKESSTILCHIITCYLTYSLSVGLLHKKSTGISKDSFLGLIKFVLTSTYFTFYNVIYKQIFDTMSSPLSIIIADIVLQDIENNKIGTTLPFYYRYVDDIILAMPKNSVQIITIFNSYHERIYFLDIKINRINDTIIIDWYQKPTQLGRYLSFSFEPSYIAKNFVPLLIVYYFDITSHNLYNMTKDCTAFLQHCQSTTLNIL